MLFGFASKYRKNKRFILEEGNNSLISFVFILIPNPLTKVSVFEKGIAKYKEGKFEEALEVFQQLTQEDPAKTEYLHYRARVQSRMGRLNKALEDFDLLIKEHPYETDYISDRAVVLHLMKRNEEALSELDRAQSLDPNNPYRYSSRAYLKDRLGDLHGAIADYEKAIELDPEDAVAYNNKGLVEEKLGYLDKSTKSFSKADHLTGYQPHRPDEHRSPGIPNAGDEAAIDEEKKDTGFPHFWSVLSQIISDRKTRKEFFRFIKNKITGS
jgi:tetratricopeptide (TPR) repeat protein